MDYFKQKLLRTEQVEHETLSHARKAMRKLAASISETIAYLDRGIHQLELRQTDRQAFFNTLANLLDNNQLYNNMHAAGVCEDLRNAQDELAQLPNAFRQSSAGDKINELISQLDGYEYRFIDAVKEFMSRASRFNLDAPQNNRKSNPKEALAALKERNASLNKILEKIENLLDQMREKTMAD